MASVTVMSILRGPRTRNVALERLDAVDGELELVAVHLALLYALDM